MQRALWALCKALHLPPAAVRAMPLPDIAWCLHMAALDPPEAPPPL